MAVNNQRIGFGLIIGGGLLLVGALFSRSGAELWPLFILIPGLVFLAAAAFGRAQTAGLFVPGSILTTLGLLFFVQSATDHYESWAYAWALIWGAVGVGLLLQGWRTGNSRLVGQGQRLTGIAAGAFLIGFVFFEGFIFGDFADSWLFRVGLPVVFIGAGAFLLLRQSESEER